MSITKSLLTVFGCAVLVACAQPTTPLPPEGATPEEVTAFFSKICTERGIPQISVEEATAQGNPSAAFAHTSCVTGLAVASIEERQRSMGL